MKVLSVLALGSAALLASGCSLFSQSDYGPTSVSGTTIEELVQGAGAPDVIGGNANFLVLGWRQAEGLSILGLFQSSKEKTHAAVVDASGNVIATASGKDSGAALSIIGGISPLHPGVSLR